MKNVKKILIVCTGNSCRSIMAEGYLVARLKEEGRDMTVISSGTGALPGMKPTEETIQVMRENGIDVSGYLSSTLNKAYVDNADVILVMTPAHREAVLNLSPDAKDKIHMLKEFLQKNNGKNNWIEDPIGKPVMYYRKIFGTIKDSLEGFLEWLKE